jgi:acyl-CoA thioesterase-1
MAFLSAIGASGQGSEPPGQAPQGKAPAASEPVEARKFEHLKDAFQNPKDDPALPRVLLIGDSISIGYTVPARMRLSGKANAHRPPVNCQHTAYGLENIDGWLGSGRWDVIHFNWGIWDTHYIDNKTGQLLNQSQERDLAPDSFHIRHSLDQYRQNLEKLVAVLKRAGARLIWASSTPSMLRKGERFEDIRKYNEAAADVMRRNGVAVDDLYALTLPNVAEWQSDDRVHFNEQGNRRLGEKVGDAIAEALPGGGNTKRQ